jgi:predicted patatin/cPLA2 family phospholipase
MCRVICINDKERPSVIPSNKWVKEGNEYNVSWIVYSIPSKTMAFELEEIHLDESCEPYGYFSANRFAIHKDDLEKFLELLKDCTDFNEINVKELVEDLEVYESQPV